MKKRIVHMYDFERTCMDGTRVMCGRDTRDVLWTGGWTDDGLEKVRITCKACRKVMELKVPVAKTDIATSS